jgi:hypothetical protein
MERENLRLYFCEEEIIDGFEKSLDLTIDLKPCGDTTRETLILDDNEVVRLSRLERNSLFKALFKKFRITDLRPKPGYPKGPYYHVNEDVFEAVYKRIEPIF